MLVAVGTMVWAYGLVGLREPLARWAPSVVSVWMLVMLAGAFSGALFGGRDFFEAAFAVPREVALARFAEHPVESGVLLFWSGPLFPLSLLMLGGMLLRGRAAPRWVGVLVCVGAVAFPASRITREAAVAHLVDVLLVVPFLYLGWRYWRGGYEPAGPEVSRRIASSS